MNEDFFTVFSVRDTNKQTKPFSTKRKLFPAVSEQPNKKQKNSTSETAFFKPKAKKTRQTSSLPHIPEIPNTFYYQTIGCRKSQQDALITGFIKNFDQLTCENQKKALELTCQKLQKDYGQYQYSGSTIALCISYGKKIVVMNLGDSLVYLIKKDNNSNISTCKRLNNLHIHKDGKDHDLAITHTIGDIGVSGISHIPEISFYEADANDILLIASDGLIEAPYKSVIPNVNDEAYIRELFECREIKNLPLGETPEALKKTAIKSGSRDNTSIIVTQIDSEKTDARMFVVFDGHGPQGEEVSFALAQNILEILNENVKQLKPSSEFKFS